MNRTLAVILVAAPLWAGELSIERLFTRPFLWGTQPQRAVWSKQGHTLLFLWNESGGRFLNLYAYHPDEKRRVQLTSLESAKDELNATPEEKDDRLRKHPMPPAGLSEFSVSRDGTRAVFSYRGDLYMVPTSGAKPAFRLTRTRAGESSPQLSPDGSRIAFERDGQLFTHNLKTGQLWQVTEIEAPARLTGYRWSPDGKRFACTVAKAPGRQLLIPNFSGRLVTASPFARSLAGDEPPEVETQVVSHEGGPTRLMESGDWGAKVHGRTLDWSPDSSRLLRIVVHPGMKMQRVLVLDASTGKTVVAAENTDTRWVDFGFACWSPDSREVLFSSDRDGWAHLYTVPAGGGTARQLTRGDWEIHTESFSEDPQWVGGFIYYTSTEQDTAERHLYRIRPDGSGKRRLSEREGLNVGLVSEDGRHIAWRLADLKNPFDLYVDGHRVTVSPSGEFHEHAWPETQFVRFPSLKDRKPVAAKMLLPPGYGMQTRKGGRFPAVLFIHGAGYATSVLKQWGSYQDLRFAFNCYLASQGYVVLDVDYRGSSGYGRDWRTGVYLHMGGPDLDDLLGGVEYLKSLGKIDARRIGIWGVSYGGFLTNMALFQSPGTFRAGVSWAAVNDWENYNAFYTAQRLTTPREDPEAYRRSSPIHFSGNLKDPLLIVHGMVDDNVLFQDSVQLIEKLIHEGRDFGQAFYPGESHGFVRDRTLIDAFRRTAQWMDLYLR